MRSSGDINGGVRKAWAWGVTCLTTLSLAVGMAACGGSDDGDGASAGAKGKALKDVSFRFDVTASGYVAPFVLAQEKGWYKEEGLNVKFGEGGGSNATLQLVANGKDTFGWADFGTLMTLVAQGAGVKAVSVIGQQSPVGVIARADGPIRTLKDLEGHRLLLNPRGASAALFKAVVEAQDLDESKIDLVNTSADVTNATLLARKRVDAFVGWETFELPAVEELKIEPLVLPFREAGVNPMNVSIVASDATIKNDPDTARAFVAASLKAWGYAADHPQEAVDVLVKQYPNVKASIATAQLEAQLKLLHTDNSEGKPIGYTAPEDVEATQQVLLDTKLLEAKKDPSSYYTDEFIPGQ
jgi:NitT/TauT family transport system substrate-binding protein